MDIGSDFPKDISLNITSSKNIIFRDYLEKLLKKYPKNKFIQIFKAYFEVKTLQKYGDAIVTSQRLRKEYFSQACLSASILLLKIQQTIKDYYNRDAKLNLWRYFQEKALMEQMKYQMMEQAILQTKICKEIKEISPDLGMIFDDSQRVGFIRKKIAQKAQEMFNTASDSYIEPLLIYAGYHLALNHSIQDYFDYRTIYCQKSRRYQKYFNQDTMVEENLSQGNIGYFLVSGNDAAPGHVVQASRVLGDYFKGDPAFYSGRLLNTFAPPCLSDLYYQVYLDREEKSPQSLIGRLNRGFTYRLEGYMVEMNWFLDIFPAVTQSCYWTLVIRPTNTTKDFLHVLENGDLDCGTKDLTERLCLPRNFDSQSGRANLKEISEELALVNEAFNMIAFPEKQNKGLLSMEKAKEIYDVYTTTGKDLYLSSLKDNPKKGETKFLYNCKMTNQIFGSYLVKLVTFEKVKDVAKKMTILTPRKCSAEAKQEEDVSVLETEGEQNLGWIDFKAIKNDTPFLTTSPFHQEINQESPRVELETHRPLNSVITRVSTNENFRKNSDNEILVSQSNRKTQRLTNKKEDFHNGGNSKSKRLSILYQKSLQEVFYPKLTRIFFCVFLGVFIFLSGCQIGLKTTLDSNVETLQNKKDAVRGAEVQNGASLSVQSLIRILNDYRTGVLTNADFPTFGPTFEPFPSYLRSNLEQLSEFNHYLFTNTSLLEPDLRDIVFEKDVKLYYSDINSGNYSRVDIFQAMYIIAQITSEVLTVDADSRMAENVNFIMINSLNDVSIKNKVISRLMSESLGRQNAEVEENVKMNFVILSSLLLTSFVCGVGIIINQCNKQIKNLNAVCRITEGKLEDVIGNFEDFQKALVDDSNFQVSFLKKKLLLPGSQVMTISCKKTQAKSPSSLKITKKYFFIVGWLALLGLITFALILITATFYRKCLSSMQKQQTMIYFADSLTTKGILTWTSARELLDTNNTAIIEYKLVSTKLEEMLGTLVDIRTAAYEINFDDIREENRGKIQSILFDEACQYLDELFAEPCLMMKSFGKKGSLVDAVNTFEGIIRARIEAYELSDKSSAALRAIELGDFAYASLNYMILRGISMKLASLLDGDYEMEVKQTQSLGKIMLIVFIIWEVMMCLIFWKLVYVRLSEGVNEFKNILKIFPAETVLSNFILKMFLMKTTSGRKSFEINDR